MLGQTAGMSFPTQQGKMFSKQLVICLTGEVTFGGDGITDLHNQHHQAEENRHGIIH
jgi:hypothetical protein